MSGEVGFLAIAILSLGMVFIAGAIGKEWVYVSVITLALTSSVTAGKVISFFTLSASAATPLYAGIFLATDYLSEIYEEEDARRAVWMGLYANIILVIGGQLIVTPEAIGGKDVSEALDVLFRFVPRLVASGLFAFVISQNIDITIFHYLKSDSVPRWIRERLWIRNNVSTMCSQLADSLIVYYGAFYGVTSNVISLVLVAWTMKVLVAILDTPFLYWLRSFYENK